MPKKKRAMPSKESKRRRTQTYWFVGVILVGAFAVYSYYLYSASSTSEVVSQTAPRNINPSVGLSIGNLAPDFRLLDPDGKIVTRDSLKGKPTMIFFTTTWCVPCQVGAKELLRYDLEAGDNAFNVLIVFVDLRETNEQLKQWKDSFGGKDWFTALDTTGMAQNYQVRYLDTKYVLDRNGVILWKDFYPLTYETAKTVLEPLIT